jgi:hypothetical protein
MCRHVRLWIGFAWRDAAAATCFGRLEGMYVAGGAPPLRQRHDLFAAIAPVQRNEAHAPLRGRHRPGAALGAAPPRPCRFGLLSVRLRSGCALGFPSVGPKERGPKGPGSRLCSGRRANPNQRFCLGGCYREDGASKGFARLEGDSDRVAALSVLPDGAKPHSATRCSFISHRSAKRRERLSRKDYWQIPQGFRRETR